MSNTMKPSCAGLAFVLVGLIVGDNVARAAEKPDIEGEVAELIKRLRSDSLREEALKRVKDLGRASSSEAKKEAVFFFHDLQARNVLLAILASENPHLESKVIPCMDVFGVESVPRLYEIGLSKLIDPERILPNLQIRALHESWAQGISEHAVTVLGVKVQEFPRSATPGEITTPKRYRAWWITVLKAAKEKGTSTRDLDALLERLEKEQAKK